MPLFTITMRAERSGPDKVAISAAIHAASVAAGYPQDDMFQRFFTLGEESLLIDPSYPDLPKPRSGNVLMIEVVVSSGTRAEQKGKLLANLVVHLGSAGVDPNDIIVFFSEIDRISSSFGNGKTASPVALG